MLIKNATNFLNKLKSLNFINKFKVLKRKENDNLDNSLPEIKNAVGSEIKSKSFDKNNIRTGKSSKEKKPKPLPPPTYVITHYKSTIGLFSKIYGRNDFKWRVGMAIIAGLLMSFASIICVQNTGVYISGTSGIFQGIARIVKTVLKKENVNDSTINLIYQLFFYGLYLITNVPLIIFSYKKMGKKFTILSSIVVILSNVIPLAINQINGVKEFFIFGNTTISDGQDLYLLDFSTSDNQVKAFSMFLYALFAGLINGLAYSIVVAVGGSTGGLDFISFFFAYKKKKPMGPILLIFNVSSILISVTIGSFIAGGINSSKNWTAYNFFSQNLMSGVIYTIIVSTVLHNLFPKDKIVKIQIYCEDVIAIRNYLYLNNFNHSLTINTTTGGYSLQEKKNIEIICLFIEVPKILAKIKEAKSEMMITISPISGIDGKLSVEEALN